jgi:microsomal dipeptidase-like Zn-dependent dipeptidase
MVSLGAMVEFTFLSCMPSRNTARPADIVSAVRLLGVDHCVVTTDFGQWMNPPPAEGMRMAIAELLHAGLSAREVETLVKTNPLTVLGL